MKRLNNLELMQLLRRGAIARLHVGDGNPVNIVLDGVLKGWIGLEDWQRLRKENILEFYQMPDKYSLEYILKVELPQEFKSGNHYFKYLSREPHKINVSHYLNGIRQADLRLPYSLWLKPELALEALLSYAR